MRLRVADVLGATRGRLLAGRADAEIATYPTDSRSVVPGGLFLALRGAALDGHAFCAGAVARGAAAVVVDRELAVPGAAVSRVEDTWRALYGLARHVLDRVAPLGVGGTGSNGEPSANE